LPNRDQEEHDGMRQRDDGAFAVGEDGEFVHAWDHFTKMAD
jgi:hypothetical protein